MSHMIGYDALYVHVCAYVPVIISLALGILLPVNTKVHRYAGVQESIDKSTPTQAV